MDRQILEEASSLETVNGEKGDRKMYAERRETIENNAVRRSEEARQRRMVRESLDSATDGRLLLCDRAEEFPVMGRMLGDPIPLTPVALRGLRARVAAAATAEGHSTERMYDLITAVGEAATNAVLHGGGGEARIFVDENGRVRVWIQDRGHGIALDELPRATLERGYSSAGTLGQGFWIILNSTDRVYLATGANGTTVLLEQGRTPRRSESAGYNRPVVLS
jgi:anti-sigma regulatory factor (Ser/Thr protein kinase)